MAKVKVYKFQYLDRREGRVVIAPDFATVRAIAEIDAIVLPETCREVDDSQVGRAGYLLKEEHRGGENPS